MIDISNTDYTEHDIELMLVHNWSDIFPNLICIERQYHVDYGVIDILAKDKEDNTWVVIELKLVRDTDHGIRQIDTAIGQVIRYMTQVRVIYNTSEVRGMILSNIIPKSHGVLNSNRYDITLHEFEEYPHLVRTIMMDYSHEMNIVDNIEGLLFRKDKVKIYNE